MALTGRPSTTLSQVWPNSGKNMDALALTEEQINGLESAINEEGDPLVGASWRWASENREVVQHWIDAARNAQ